MTYSPNQPMDGVKLGFSYDLSKIKIKNQNRRNEHLIYGKC